MVLEHIFPEDWLEKKARFAFLLGVGYSLIGIILARLLFPSDPALVAVAFTSLLLLPELYKIFTIEERQERMEKKFSFKHLLRDDIDVVKIYSFLFIGILLTYSIATMLLPAFTTNDLFREQLEIREGATGEAIATGNAIEFSPGLFKSLLANNFRVLMVCFIVALLTGDGAIFIITWNASVWGTIFGFTAKSAAACYTGMLMPLYFFGIIFTVVFPHMMIEALSYFCAAIAGSIISKDMLLEKFKSKRFKKVLKFNLYLFLIALALLLLGALVETYVLDNVGIYRELITLSFIC